MLHTSFPAQAFPHLPQFAGSDATSEHAPPHTVSPPPHEHAPARHAGRARDIAGPAVSNVVHEIHARAAAARHAAPAVGARVGVGRGLGLGAPAEEGEDQREESLATSVFVESHGEFRSVIVPSRGFYENGKRGGP
jgi:hypothetical protein